jgi:Domain of unknown function (DUF1707)
MASQPSLRIGDREREATAAELREHYAHGRLTLAEFNQRLDATFAAKTQSDLSRITSDLPHVRPYDVPLPSSQVGRPRQQLMSRATTDALLQSAGGDDRQHRDHHHPGGLATTLLAALVAWLLVYNVILVGLSWPLAGRLGLLIAIFAVIRGLLRRIFGGRGGPVRRGRGRRC